MRNLSNILVLVFAGITMLGCAWSDEKPDKPEVVYQPVMQYPDNFPEVEEPELPVDQLTEADRADYQKVSQAFVISIERLKKALRQYEEYAEQYRWTEEERNNTELEEIEKDNGK